MPRPAAPSNWIRLNPRALNRVETTRIDGIEIAIGMSPYDLPDGVRGLLREEAGEFVIEFKYLKGSSEKRIPRTQQEQSLTFMVGEHSGRLYEIRVPLRMAQSNQVNLQLLIPQLDNAIERMSERIIPNRLQNYEVAREVIDQNRDRIFSDLVPSG